MRYCGNVLHNDAALGIKLLNIFQKLSTAII